MKYCLLEAVTKENCELKGEEVNLVWRNSLLVVVRPPCTRVIYRERGNMYKGITSANYQAKGRVLTPKTGRDAHQSHVQQRTAAQSLDTKHATAHLPKLQPPFKFPVGKRE